MSNAGKSILVVDDEPNVRLMLRSTLEADGFSVTEACDGEEAIQSVEQLRPALVLLDLWMHRGDGMQVLEYLNRKAPEDHPRVIVLTAHGRVPVVVKAMRLGASDFLEKPTTPEDLRLSVSAALEDAPEKNPQPVEQTPSRTAAKLGPVLAGIRSAVWNQDIRLTERILTALFRKAWSDPAYFNLLGAVFEAEGNRGAAKTFYQKSADSRAECEAAKQNLQRLNELNADPEHPADAVLGGQNEFLKMICDEHRNHGSQSNHPDEGANL